MHGRGSAVKRSADRPQWKWPLKLGAGLAVTAGILLAAEGVLRLSFGAPPHPIMVRSMMGEHESYFVAEQGFVHTTYQTFEPDGACPPFAVAAEEPRIAVLGGSSLRYNFDLPPSGRFSDLIADRTGVETLNLGCSGADTHDLKRVLEQLLSWPMSLVVLYTGHCDVGNAFMLQRYASVGDRTAARLQPLRENSQLFVQYRKVLSPVSRTELPGAEREGLRPGEVASIERAFERNLHHMITLCKTRDVPLVLCVPTSDLTRPVPESESEPYQRARRAWEEGMALLATDPERATRLLEEARDSSAGQYRATNAVEAIIRRLAREEGVTLVDARRDLPTDSSGAVPEPGLFIPDGLHLSANGHRALADLLVPAVLEQLPQGTANAAAAPGVGGEGQTEFEGGRGGEGAVGE
jgi:lysophospholipase L1-like esterase